MKFKITKDTGKQGTFDDLPVIEATDSNDLLKKFLHME